MPSLRRRVTTTVLIVAAFYVGIVGLAWLYQDRLLFVAMGLGAGRPVDELPGVEVEWLERSGGERFRVAVTAAPPGAPCVVVGFVGNGEDLRSGIHWAAAWRDHGFGAVVVEYPGYGDSEGSPSVESFFEAARVAAERARALAGDRPLVAVGSSLGSFPATYLAAEGVVSRLLLRAPPTSIAAAGQRSYPFLPVRWLLRHRFDNLALAPDVSCPVLVIHGDQDTIVPVAMGRQLAEAFPNGEFVGAEGYGHNDLPIDGAGPFGARVHAFLAGVAEKAK